jgi:hypothetical protein
MPNVEKVQAGYKAQPLSAYLKQPAPSAAPAIDFPKVDAELVKKNFFEYLDFALQFAPAGPEERTIREKLARIGVGAGKPFDFKDLPLTHKLEIGLGMKDGEDKVVKYLAEGSKNINGWKVGSLFGDRLFYSGDWLKRAAAAKGGIYGNDAVEAVYPLTKTLANGEVLDCSKHNYSITFAAGQYPPVEAFWSVTMYDGKTQLLIENPINRYFDQLADAARHEEECRWLSHTASPKKFTWRRQGVQLVAGAEWRNLPGHAAILAEDRSSIDPAPRQRHLAAARHQARVVNVANLRRSRSGRPVRRFAYETQTGKDDMKRSTRFGRQSFSHSPTPVLG